MAVKMRNSPKFRDSGQSACRENQGECLSPGWPWLDRQGQPQTHTAQHTPRVDEDRPHEGNHHAVGSHGPEVRCLSLRGRGETVPRAIARRGPSRRKEMNTHSAFAKMTDFTPDPNVCLPRELWDKVADSHVISSTLSRHRACCGKDSETDCPAFRSSILPYEEVIDAYESSMQIAHHGLLPSTSS